MSLVGSLEDLGLGDILQMLGLSRKSGLLLLRSQSGSGRILVDAGLVRGAWIEDDSGLPAGPRAAGSLAERRGSERTRSGPYSRGFDAGTAVGERTEAGMDPLCREQVERAVLRMFCWRHGEFRFEFTQEITDWDPEVALAKGINPQYLTIEATRLGDEAQADERRVLDDETMFFERPVASDRGFCDDEGVVSERSAPDDPAIGVVRPPCTPSNGTGVSALPVDAAFRRLPPLVVMDSELRTLEWIKSELSPLFARVHIFQNCECGVARIRQYLGRGEVPAVLVSSRVSDASLTGATDPGDLVRRLRAQAPGMPILALRDAGSEAAGLDGADAVLTRPPPGVFADTRQRDHAEALARELRSAVAQWTGARRTPCS